jgi:hypothetical protein
MRRFIGLTVFAAFACSSYSAPTQTPDAGSSGSDDGSIKPPTGILYVSLLGKDGNAGTSSDAPLLSVAAAFSLLEAKNLSGVELRVCAGTYPIRNLASTRVQAIRGGYNCQTWTRSAAFGTLRGNLSDGANLTTLEGSALEGIDRPSLALSGALAHQIEGIEITRHEGGAASLYAESNLELLASHVVGASKADGRVDAPSIAVQVKDAQIRIVQSVLEGKGGTAPLGTTTPASSGLFLTNVSGTVENSGIVAGGGYGTYACESLHAAGGDSLTLDNVDVECTNSEAKTLTGTTYPDNFGIALNSAQHGRMRILNSRVKMGVVAAPLDQYLNIVAISSSAENLEMSNTRVNSGEASSFVGRTRGHGLITGIETMPKVRTISNSLFLGGCTQGGNAYPLWVRGGTTTLEHVTSGNPVSIAVALYADFGAQVVARNSVFLSATANGVGVDTCSLSKFSGNNNFLFAQSAFVVFPGDGKACSGGSESFGVLSRDSVFAADNFSMLFNVPVAGAAAAMLGPGLIPSKCALARGGVPLAGLTKDIDGKMRSAEKPSLGAWENTGNCTP